MAKINVAIIDDESKSIETLSILLKNYHADVNIISSAGSMSAGLSMIEKHREEIDILFLDIQMPEGDGFTLLQHLPEINFKVIFTTAYDQYAIKAIKFSALDYLLKPIDNTELQDALAKYRELKLKNVPAVASLDIFKQALQQKKVFEKLAIPTSSDIVFIELPKILYLESSNNYTTLHLENKQKILSSKNIGYYEELLEQGSFFRIHNSYLVNLEKIERFIKGKTGAVQLQGGTVLDVSVRRKDSLLERLSLYR